jgi:hypothetical protein
MDGDLQKDCVELLERATLHSHYYSALCPFHDDHSPSFFVYPDGFRCSACGKWGTLDYLYGYLTKRDTVSHYREPEKSATPRWRTWLQKYGTWHDFAVEAYRKGKEFPVLMNYIKKQRGLADVIETAKIGWMDYWFVFPVFDRHGDVVDITVRAAPTLQTDIRYSIRPREKGETTPLYADWKLVDEGKVVYVVFGILDRLTLTQLGVPAVTGISGKTISHELLKGIRKPMRIIPDYREEVDASRLVKQLGWRGKQVRVDWPEGCKDINDVYVRYGKDMTLSLIKF